MPSGACPVVCFCCDSKTNLVDKNREHKGPQSTDREDTGTHLITFLLCNCRGFSPVLHDWYYYSYCKLGKGRFHEAKSNTISWMRPAAVYCFSRERKVGSFEDWVVIFLDFYPSLSWLSFILLLHWKGSLLLPQRKSQKTFFFNQGLSQALLLMLATMWLSLLFLETRPYCVYCISHLDPTLKINWKPVSVFIW